jgi:hypothetical protein
MRHLTTWDKSGAHNSEAVCATSHAVRDWIAVCHLGLHILPIETCYTLLQVIFNLSLFKKIDDLHMIGRCYWSWGNCTSSSNTLNGCGWLPVQYRFHILKYALSKFRTWRTKWKVRTAPQSHTQDSITNSCKNFENRRAPAWRWPSKTSSVLIWLPSAHQATQEHISQGEKSSKL